MAGLPGKKSGNILPLLSRLNVISWRNYHQMCLDQLYPADIPVLNKYGTDFAFGLECWSCKQTDRQWLYQV